MKKDTKYVLIEMDDDFPVHLEASTMKDMKKMLFILFRKKGGYNDTVILTRKEYTSLMEEVGLAIE